jgi:cellulose 1,4-beta-cellobiosidase
LIGPGAQILSDVWRAAGSPSQVRGFATNVANYNAYSQIPGEFSSDLDAQYNSAQDEQRYVHLLGAALAAIGAPNHAIVDTGRNGVTGLRLAQGDWCNIKGAGFGVLPTGTTGDALTDAFVWVKLGGESDGVSDPTADRYSPVCGQTEGKYN